MSGIWNKALLHNCPRLQSRNLPTIHHCCCKKWKKLIYKKDEFVMFWVQSCVSDICLTWENWEYLLFWNLIAQYRFTKWESPLLNAIFLSLVLSVDSCLEIISQIVNRFVVGKKKYDEFMYHTTSIPDEIQHINKNGNWKLKNKKKIRWEGNGTVPNRRNSWPSFIQTFWVPGF